MEDSWALEVVPRLPANLADEARALKASAGAKPCDPLSLRGVLAYVLGPLRRACWALGRCWWGSQIFQLRGKRLRASSPWLLWSLSELVATSEVSAPLGVCPRISCSSMPAVSASQVGRGMIGGCIWPTTLLGRLGQVQVTDRRGGEHLGRYQWQAGDVIVADRGYGYRRSVALALRQQADVVLRIHHVTFPLETDTGQPFTVLRGSGNGARRHGTGTAGVAGKASAIGSGSLPPSSIRPPRSRRGAASAAKRKSRAHPHGAHAGRGRLAPRDYHPVGCDLVAHRRAVPVSGALASGARV